MKHKLIYITIGLSISAGLMLGGAAFINTGAGKEQISHQAFQDITYVQNQPHERHQLDIYVPTHTDGPAPLLIWIHGGLWIAGSKDTYNADVFSSFLKAGVAVATLNYRLSTTDTFPAQLHDVKAAVRFLRANAHQYGLDPNHIVAAGHSAGGHLAAMLGTTHGIAQFEDLTMGYPAHSSHVSAVLAYSTITDFTSASEWQPVYSRVGIDWRQSFWLLSRCGNVDDCAELAKDSSPITYVDSNTVPFYLWHGALDTIVPLSQSLDMCAELQSNGVHCTLETDADGWHFAKLTPTTIAFLSKIFEQDLPSVNSSAEQPS